VRNLDFIRSLPAGITIHELGARLYEALSDVDAQQQTIAQQTNTDPTGQPLPPPAIDGLTVTGQNGHFHAQIQHGGEFYRGVQYHLEYADNPSFHKPHTIDMGASREHTVSLGNGTYYWRAHAAYASSPGGPPAYHGGAHSPQPVSGGGIVGPPALLDPQGSGTGAPGEGLSGPGPIPFRTSTGRPPIRGQSTAGGGSTGGSLAPSPQTGLPEGMASLGTSGGGAWIPQLVTVAQSGLAALAATLDTGSAGLRVYVSDYDHTLVWSGTGWIFASGERAGYVEAFLVDPSPATGWQLCDGTAGVTYLKSDGSTGSLTVPDLVGSPSYLKFGVAVTGINAAVAPGLTMNSYTPTGTVSQPTFSGGLENTSSDSGGTPAGTVSTPTITVDSKTLTTTNFVTLGGASPGVNEVSHSHTASSSALTFSGSSLSNHNHTVTATGTVSQPTFTGTAATLTGSISAIAEPQNIVLRPWFRK